MREESPLLIASLILRLRHPDIDLDASGEEAALGFKTVPPFSCTRETKVHKLTR